MSSGCGCKEVYTVLDIKRVENAMFHTMYIFSVILHAIDKQDIAINMILNLY